MKRIIYIPLEHIDSRYTVHLDRDIVSYFKNNAIDFIRIYPDVQSPGLKPGMFLDANFTTKFKSLQMAMISDLYQSEEITNNDVFFFSDLWFPGIESIQYMNHFNSIHPKIHGLIHAGSFTDTDEVRNLERWAKNFEDIVFDISDKIFLGSEFIKNDILKKRNVSRNKLTVTGLPIDEMELTKYKNSEKENIVIFNGRNHPEKQPKYFFKLREIFKHTGWEFIWTQELNLNKNQYYSLLAKSKVIVSFALQENFGYGIQEAVQLGAYPVLPNRLAYSEQFGDKHLYDDFDDCISKLSDVLLNNADTNIIQYNHSTNVEIFNQWFNS